MNHSDNTYNEALKDSYRKNIPLRLLNSARSLTIRAKAVDKDVTDAIKRHGGEALESAGGMLRHQAANLMNYGVRGLFNGAAGLAGTAGKGIGALQKAGWNLNKKATRMLPGPLQTPTRAALERAEAWKRNKEQAFLNSETGQTMSRLKAGYNDVFDNVVASLKPSSRGAYEQAIAALKRDHNPAVRYGTVGYHALGANAPAAALLTGALQAGSQPLLKGTSKGLTAIGKRLPSQGIYNWTNSNLVSPILNTGKLGFNVAGKHPVLGSRFISPAVNATVNNMPFLGLLGSHVIRATQSPLDALQQTSYASLGRNAGGFMGRWSRSGNLLKGVSRIAPGFTDSINNMVGNEVVAPTAAASLRDPVISRHLNDSLRDLPTTAPKNILNLITTIKGHPYLSKVARLTGNYTANSINPNLSFDPIRKQRALNIPNIARATIQNPELKEAALDYINHPQTKAAVLDGAQTIPGIPPAVANLTHSATRTYATDVLKGRRDIAKDIQTIQDNGGLVEFIKNKAVEHALQLNSPEGQARAQGVLTKVIQDSPDLSPYMKDEALKLVDDLPEILSRAQEYSPYLIKAPAVLRPILQHFSKSQKRIRRGDS